MKVHRTYRNWDSPDCHINILKFNNKRIMPLFTPHLHNELEILYFVKGVYEVYGLRQNFQIKSPMVYIVPPNEIHSVRSLCEDGRYLSLAVETSAISMNQDHFFQKSFVEPLHTGNLSFPRVFRSSDPGFPELSAYLEKLMQIKENDPAYRLRRFQYTIGLCAELMPYCDIVQKYNNDREGSEIARRCVIYMYENYYNRLSLAELADYIHIHPNYLCSVFKKSTGLTVMEYLNRIRMERAREFLQKGDLTIGQVAERCGYQSISAFQRTFKTHTGTTPSSFASKARR